MIIEVLCARSLIVTSVTLAATPQKARSTGEKSVTIAPCALFSGALDNSAGVRHLRVSKSSSTFRDPSDNDGRPKVELQVAGLSFDLTMGS